ncbi:MAG: hypothetical protein K5888_12300 [Lachnospiraceae bacterium]|nr:hypothetical protein [Lachnospiraceae bacterium]
MSIIMALFVIWLLWNWVIAPILGLAGKLITKLFKFVLACATAGVLFFFSTIDWMELLERNTFKYELIIPALTVIFIFLSLDGIAITLIGSTVLFLLSLAPGLGFIPSLVIVAVVIAAITIPVPVRYKITDIVLAVLTNEGSSLYDYYFDRQVDGGFLVWLSYLGSISFLLIRLCSMN